MAPPLPPAALAPLSLLVANAHSSRAGPMLDHPAVIKALAETASRELGCSAQQAELVLAFFCKVRSDLHERIRRGVAGTLKVLDDERGPRWANELLPLVRKRMQVQRYSPPRPKRMSPAKINIKNRPVVRVVARSVPKLHKRDEQPRTAEEERSFGVYWKQVARTITFPKLLHL